MKIHILGASGSGVTTLGNALGKKLAIPYFDSDNYYWEKSDPPFTIKRDINERYAVVNQLLHQHDDWIFGGSVISWDMSVFPAFDLIVFLWIPASVRMERIKAREYARYGDHMYNDPQQKKSTEDFLIWAADYDNNTGIATRTLQAQEAWLAKRTCPVLEIRGDYTTEQRVAVIMDKLNNL